MTLEAAPTPCSRTGFHITSISWNWPGGTMIISPGAAASVVTCDLLLVVRNRRGGRSRVRVVRHQLIAECVDGDRVTGRAYPWSGNIDAGNAGNRRSGSRIGAVRVVVTCARKCRRRD